VYSTYANGCATERVQPLNPASFGKLVRVIFPGIQTRRLGIRGESKYHYVDLALKGDVPDGDSMTRNIDVGQQQTITADFPWVFTARYPCHFLISFTVHTHGFQ